MTHWQRILFCLRYGIGDVLMEMPALRGLRSTYPAAEICLLGARPALELFQDDADFHSLICVQDFGFKHWGDRGSRQARERFQHWFTTARFDCVLDPFHAVVGIHDLLTTGGVAWRSANPASRSPGQLTGGHGIAAIWHSAVANWGLDSQRNNPPPAPRLHIPPAASRLAEQRLTAWRRCTTGTRGTDGTDGTGGRVSEGGVHADKVNDSRDTGGKGATGKDNNIVGIAPVASSELKRWPIDRVLELIQWLVRERHRRVLIFGVGYQQDPLLRRLRQATGPQALAVIAPTHLQETAALAARCQLFISNDTGLMHLAAAVSTPTVGIFGPTAAHIYLPGGCLAVNSDRPCAYRLHEDFGPPQCIHAQRCLIAANSCIDTVTTEAVTNAVDRLLFKPHSQDSEQRL
jgi:ADP-heptose:LPS heptosyltransferase